MKKSVKIRKIIFEILFEIYQKNVNFEESYNNFTKNIYISNQDRAMIYNVVLNSMRNNFYVSSILNQFLNKRTSIKIKILLLSAITQILYLDFKNYAVTNDSVQVAKIKKLNPGLINSLLKNLIANINKIKKNEINKNMVPHWLKKDLKIFKTKIDYFIETISKEPSLHLVFKNKILLDNFNEKIVRTTETSGFLVNKKKISEIEDFNKGVWWVQDFSSMLPIYLSSEIKFKKIIDLCSAPGGKAFQTLSLQNDLILNDISKKRTIILKNNLKRLNFDSQINNNNALNLPEKEDFDAVVLDSPCSGTGTIRRNPEILFKKKPPDLDFLTKVQKRLVNKAAKLLNKNGIIIYMVCSFFYDETKNIKNNFLNENKNFSQYKFSLGSNNKFEKFLDNDGDIFCIPSKHNNYMVDGFYSVKFIKNG